MGRFLAWTRETLLLVCLKRASERANERRGISPGVGRKRDSGWLVPAHFVQHVTSHGRDEQLESTDSMTTGGRSQPHFNMLCFSKHDSGLAPHNTTLLTGTQRGYDHSLFTLEPQHRARFP